MMGDGYWILEAGYWMLHTGLKICRNNLPGFELAIARKIFFICLSNLSKNNFANHYSKTKYATTRPALRNGLWLYYRNSGPSNYSDRFFPDNPLSIHLFWQECRRPDTGCWILRAGYFFIEILFGFHRVKHPILF